jgi:predicted DNA-binding protein (UPF0251 family)
MESMIGHNGGPSPFEESQTEITDLYGEAKLWMDGTPVETQEQADAINTLKDKIKKAAKKAEENRKVEIKPHQDAADEVQARYNTLIGKNKSVTGLAVKAEEACNAALRPYLLELDRQQREKAELARQEAEKLRLEAMEAMRQRDAANLEQREVAEKLVADAKAAEEVAKKADNAKAHAKGYGRATGLRTVWKAVMTNERDAAAWLWAERREELMQFVQEQADKAVRSGARSIKGFDVREEKVL